MTRRTGLRISTYFSGVKLRWLIDNEEAVANAVANGTALFGTIDTWLVWNLAQGNPHVTDVTNAGRTMLMNINSLEWDDHMLDFIGVTRDILPEIRSSSEMFGTMSCTKLKGVPISGLIGDQQAALVGQSCFNVGEAKSTYGTGGFLIVNTGLEAKFSRSGLLTTPAYKLGPDAPCVYSLEGSIGVAGSAVTWLRDGVGMISSARETEEIASSVTDTGNVYVVPAFTGLFAPWWREDARGTIVGMTQFTTRAHIVRAVLEAITFKVNTVLGAATEDMGHPIAELKVDGGVSNNNLAMQMQADITNTRVVRPRVTETTALGAAFCAGHVVGLYQSMDHFREAWELDREFTSQITQEMRQHKLNMWNKAVQKSLGWGDDEEENVGETSLFPAANLVTRHLLTGLAMGIAMTCAGLTVAQRLSRK